MMDKELDFKPVSKHWNRVDTLIYKIEKAINNLIDQWKESEDPDPNIDEIIAAETQHLKSENEKYKRMLYPTELVFRDGKNHCPECDIEIPDNYQGKCCSECGQRIKKCASDERKILFGSESSKNEDDCKGIHNINVTLISRAH